MPAVSDAEPNLSLDWTITVLVRALVNPPGAW